MGVMESPQIILMELWIKFDQNQIMELPNSHLFLPLVPHSNPVSLGTVPDYPNDVVNLSDFEDMTLGMTLMRLLYTGYNSI